MRSNAPEFLANFAQAVVDEAPGYFVMLRLYQDFTVPELLQMIYMDTSLYQRFRSFKVDRPGSGRGLDPSPKWEEEVLRPFPGSLGRKSE